MTSAVSTHNVEATYEIPEVLRTSDEECKQILDHIENACKDGVDNYSARVTKRERYRVTYHMRANVQGVLAAKFRDWNNQWIVAAAEKKAAEPVVDDLAEPVEPQDNQTSETQVTTETVVEQPATETATSEQTFTESAE